MLTERRVLVTGGAESLARICAIGCWSAATKSCVSIISTPGRDAMCISCCQILVSS